MYYFFNLYLLYAHAQGEVLDYLLLMLRLLY